MAYRRTHHDEEQDLGIQYQSTTRYSQPYQYQQRSERVHYPESTRPTGFYTGVSTRPTRPSTRPTRPSSISSTSENRQHLTRVWVKNNGYLDREDKVVEYRVETTDLHGFHLKEAMGKVKQILSRYKNEVKNSRTGIKFQIIVGKGNNSDGKKPIIKPAVEKYLTDKQFDWSYQKKNNKVNEGCLVVYIPKAELCGQVLTESGPDQSGPDSAK